MSDIFDNINPFHKHVVFHASIPKSVRVEIETKLYEEHSPPLFLGLSHTTYNMWAQRLVALCTLRTPVHLVMNQQDVTLFQASFQANIKYPMLDVVPGTPIAEAEKALTTLRSFANDRLQALRQSKQRELATYEAPIAAHVHTWLHAFVAARVRAFVDNWISFDQEATVLGILGAFGQLEGKFTAPLLRHNSWMLGIDTSIPRTYRNTIDILKAYDKAIRPILTHTREVARATRKEQRDIQYGRKPRPTPQPDAQARSSAPTTRCPVCHALRMDVDLP